MAPPPPRRPARRRERDRVIRAHLPGDQEDTFDLGPQTGGGGGTAYGNRSGPVYLGGSETIGARRAGARERVDPAVHIVRKGDTLWAICDEYFRNPYQWPRIWSYNPQLQNPHWIYPGDQVRLRSPGQQEAKAAGGPSSAAMAPGNTGSFIDRRRQVTPDTIFLRDNGYVEDEKTENWGDITGAPEDQMFLSDLDQVYLRILPEHDVKLGQELTIYRPTRAVGKGTIVEIQGTVRIDEWDAKHRIARAQIVESLDVIERGARIGPIGRRFDIVPPQRNDADVKAEVLASVYPAQLLRAEPGRLLEQGVERRPEARQPPLHHPPRRRLAAEPRDERGRRSASRSRATRPRRSRRLPRPKDEGRFPETVVAELRILATRPASSTAMVSMARSEIELGDVAVARKGTERGSRPERLADRARRRTGDAPSATRCV